MTEVAVLSDFKVRDLSLAELAARRSAWPSTRCPA